MFSASSWNNGDFAPGNTGRTLIRYLPRFNWSFNFSKVPGNIYSFICFTKRIFFSDSFNRPVKFIVIWFSKHKINKFPSRCLMSIKSNSITIKPAVFLISQDKIGNIFQKLKIVLTNGNIQNYTNMCVEFPIEGLDIIYRSNDYLRRHTSKNIFNISSAMKRHLNIIYTCLSNRS